MNITKINSLILVLYIYLSSFSLLIYMFDSTLIRYALYGGLIVITLILNNMKFSKSFLYVLISIVLLLGINTLAVDYKNYVIGDSTVFLLTLFIPFYLFSLRNINYDGITIFWYKSSVVFTILLPCYYFLYVNDNITYLELGTVTHLNIIIQSMFFFKNISKQKITPFFLIVINFAVGLIFGSRMILVASISVIVVAAIIVVERNKIKRYFFLGLSLISSIFILINLEAIIRWLIYLLLNRGIRSRNLLLFYDQIQNGSDNVYYAGREDVYETAVNYLSTNGYFPSGFSVIRHLTHDTFYHSHNFFLEIFIMFGFIFGSLFIMIFIFKFIVKIKKIGLNNTLSYILCLITCSFIVRSLTGTNFIVDTLFLISIAIIFSGDRKIVNLNE
ncbi:MULTISPECIES: hypothetical protein [Priestia]|uniref:O-antigen ligase n=1 Tax=Priestia aryabhattai TaxID=412384 RepID=A0ABD7WZ16_PRIAR|nr:hypothetical protein [Priestia aryabhattai]WEA45475.1 hypothetical protein PWO00_05750 [Priestia aryabhattai]